MALHLRERLAPPSICAICRSWGRRRVCEGCWTRFAAAAARCRRCALALPALARSESGICGTCLASPPAFDSARARVDYAFPWDRAISAYKFHGATELAASFADGVVESVGDARVDLVVPVPLAPRRLRERGGNQAWEIARRVARRTRTAADPALVVRIRETAHQLALPLPARSANVRGAFAVEPLRRESVRGRRIAVVDDVMTTGSTIGEIAVALKQAGAARVDAWVFARTPPPGVG